MTVILLGIDRVWDDNLRQTQPGALPDPEE